MRKIVFFLMLLNTIAAASQPFTETTYKFDQVTIIRRHYAELRSTQETIAEHLKDVSDQQWIMVSADSQRGGKGMWGRSWVSPPGNVFVSFAFSLSKLRENLSYLSQIAGVVVCDTLQEYGLRPQLRWVNNVLIGDEKIGGILCEGSVNNSVFKAIIGIGINVSMELATAQKIDQPVTSMLLKLGAAPPIDEVLDKLRTNFHRRFSNVTTFPDTFKNYEQLLAYKGQEVTIYTGQNTIGAPTHFTGIFENVTSKGYIVLQNYKDPFPNGEIVPKPK